MSSESEVKIIAVDDAGATRDVTHLAQVSVDSPDRLTAEVSGSDLRLRFGLQRGAVTLRVNALGLTLDKPVWVTLPALAERQLQRIGFVVGEGLSMLIPNPDGSISILPGRPLLISVRVFYEGGYGDINDEAEVSFSEGAAVSYRAVVDGRGVPTHWMGETIEPGTSVMRVRWGGFEASQTIQVATGFTLRAPWAEQAGITENALGRSTAYMLVGDDLTTRQLAYVESAGDDRWGTPVVLSSPPSEFPILSNAKTVEAPNGYRAALTTNSQFQSWIHLIGPTGDVKGPTVVTDGSNDTTPLRIAVTSDGDAHVWLREGFAITRKLVSFSDGQVSTVSNMPLPDTTYGSPQVAVASDGTVGLAWIDDACNVHFAFDSLNLPNPSGPNAYGSARISECDPVNFANILTKFDVAAGGSELGIVIAYGTAFSSTTTEVVIVGSGGVRSMNFMDRDHGVTVGSPRIAMDPSGEFVALWVTTSRGVWAVHRPAGSTSPASPFLVEAPFFSLGTPGIEGVLSRGDGRFLLVWHGGQSAQRTPLEMRNYSASSGLGDRMSFPYQHSTATNWTTLVATPYGISAAWSSLVDLNLGEFDAMQRFLP